MPCKVEQSGTSLISLEMRLFLLSGHLAWCHKSRLANVWSSESNVANERVPALWSSNRGIYLRTILPSALMKCVHYGSSPDMACVAILNLIVGLSRVGFPIPTVIHRLLSCTIRRAYPNYVTEYLHTLLRQAIV